MKIEKSAFDFSLPVREKKEEQLIFNPEGYVSDLLFENINSELLDRIDESDLPIPPNFVEACVGKKFLNSTVLPRQIQIASQFLGEICPFCSDPKAIDNLYDQKLSWIYDHIYFLRHGVCPKCHKTKIDIMNSGKWTFPNSLFVCAGQRSGKSIFSGGLLPHYQNMRMLTMTNKKGNRVIPYKYLKNPPSPLYGSFTAVSLGQAIKNLWEPFKGYLDSPWYKTYFEILDYYGKKLGVELYKNTTLFLQFNHKKIGWLPEAPNKKLLRGKTRIFFSSDELSWYDLHTTEESIRGSAKEIMAAGRNSLLTVRRKALFKFSKGNYNIPTGIECYVSSPAEANDILMRKVREAKKDPSMLSYRYATWEFNPDYSSPDDINEPDKMILMRDFGANPPLGNSPYYSDSKSLVSMIGNKKNMVSFEMETSTNSFGDVSIYPKISTINYVSTYPKILSIDNGLSGNCFAACCSHLENNKVVTDFLVCIKPSKKNKINLSKCFEEFVLKLVENKSLNIVLVSYDRWNSAQVIDALKDRGTKSVQYSITYKDFMEIKNSFGTGSFVFLKPDKDPSILVNYDGDFDFVEMSLKDPSFGLLYQILTVRDMGKYLTKPTFGDDDIFRAWALGCALIRDEDYINMFNKEGIVSSSSNRALGSISCSRGRRTTATKGNNGVAGALVRKNT